MTDSYETSDGDITPAADSSVAPAAAPAPSDALRDVYVGTWRDPAGDPLPRKPYKGTPIWRRLVALVGLGAFSVLGGIVIALTIAALIATAAIVLQLVIS